VRFKTKSRPYGKCAGGGSGFGRRLAPLSGVGRPTQTQGGASLPGAPGCHLAVTSPRTLLKSSGTRSLLAAVSRLDSRILSFCTLSVTVMGDMLTTIQYRRRTIRCGLPMSACRHLNCAAASSKHRGRVRGNLLCGISWERLSSPLDRRAPPSDSFFAMVDHPRILRGMLHSKLC
jgi:hypothetical protein